MDILFYLALAVGICIAFYYASRWAFRETASLRDDKRSVRKLMEELEEWRKKQ